MAMSYETYSEKVRDLFKSEIRDGDPLDAMIYLISKLVTEAWELIEEKTDEAQFLECGDCFWYHVNASRILGIDLRRTPGFGDAFQIEIYNRDLEKLKIKLLGKSIYFLERLIKEKFHNKPFSTGDKIVFWYEINEYLFNIINCMDYRLHQVLEGNIQKLEDRHGTTYNPEFYQK